MLQVRKNYSGLVVYGGPTSVPHSCCALVRKLGFSPITHGPSCSFYYILWDPALHCGTSMAIVVRATLFSAILGWLAPNLHFNLINLTSTSPDPPERCTVLKIIIKSTFLLNFLKFVYVKNPLGTLVHQTANSELGKQARQRRSCVAKDWASSLII